MNQNINWETIAHDYNSPYFRNHLWTHSFFLQAKLLNIPRTEVGIYCHDNKIDYFTNISTWHDAHTVLRKKSEEDYHFLHDILEKVEQSGKSAWEWTEKNIDRADISTMSNQTLGDILEKCIPFQETLYAYGTALVILDFAGFSFIEENLKKILDEKISPKEKSEYYKVFTAPPHFSFAQEQEIAMLGLMIKFYGNKKLYSDLPNLSWNEITHTHPEFAAALEKHAKKYGWIYYVYAGPAFTAAQFLDFVKDYLHKKVNPAEKIAEIKNSLEKIVQKKSELTEILGLNEFEKAIVSVAGLIVWSKPRRKDYQSRVYFQAEKVQREISKRLALTLEQVRSAPVSELKRGLDGQDIDLVIINKIKKEHVCVPGKNGEIITLFGQEAIEFGKTINYKIEQTKMSQNTVTGSTAFPGKVTGTVKIVNTPADLSKMNYGDILVSTATTPSIIAAMKKAAAIVTDEGGLTCHASIVSRELAIPCVVGTKHATRFLHDGEQIEVNASNGTVSIIT